MLGKLLKHELRATSRIMLPVYALLVISTGLFVLFVNLSNRYDVLALEVFRMITGAIFCITIVGVSVLTLALMVYRFYKNYMTDEGYLMFTLPVSTGELIWSKLIVSVVWSLASSVLSCVAGLLALNLIPEVRISLPNLSELLDMIGLSSGQLTLYIIELALMLLFSTLSSFLMFYGAIALGHSFANHKIGLSVVFYLAFSTAQSIILSFAGVYGIIGLAEGGAFDAAPDPGQVYQLTVLGSGGLSLLIGAALYILTHQMLKRRLNLQ